MNRSQLLISILAMSVSSTLAEEADEEAAESEINSIGVKEGISSESSDNID